MPFVQAFAYGIEHTIEWKLIDDLRQMSNRFGPPGDVEKTRSSTTLKLRNAINELERQIRRTFTIVQFDLLLQLQNETQSHALTPRMHKDSRQNTWGDDSDDVSSQSSTEEYLEDYSSDSSHQDLGPVQPSVREAQSRLERLCEFLEARVPLNPRDDNAIKYPRLTGLIERIKSMPDSSAPLNVIPTFRPEPMPFLFNIAEDEATAGAYIAFIDPTQAKPSKEIRRRMTADATKMAKFFLSFNSFVDALQMSTGTLDALTRELTPKRMASYESLASFSLLRKFQHQTEAACRAVLSHIASCGHPKHEVLLQLPGWEEVSQWDSTKATTNLPVPLFFTMCLLDQKTQKSQHGELDSWQYARMFFLQ